MQPTKKSTGARAPRSAEEKESINRGKTAVNHDKDTDSKRSVMADQERLVAGTIDPDVYDHVFTGPEEQDEDNAEPNDPDNAASTPSKKKSKQPKPPSIGNVRAVDCKLVEDIDDISEYDPNEKVGKNTKAVPFVPNCRNWPDNLRFFR